MSLYTPILISALLFSFVSSFLLTPASSPLTDLLRETSQKPGRFENHFDLAHLYKQLAQKELANKEFLLAKTVINPHVQSEKVLGDVDTQPNALAITTQQEVAYWEKITKEYPHYRDGWVQLLFLAKTANQEKLLIQAWEVLEQLDPNFTATLPNAVKP